MTRLTCLSWVPFPTVKYDMGRIALVPFVIRKEVERVGDSP